MNYSILRSANLEAYLRPAQNGGLRRRSSCFTIGSASEHRLSYTADMEGPMIDIRVWFLAGALATGVLLSPLTAVGQERIKLGLLPFSESLAAVIADKQGYFKQEGLEVEASKFDSGAIAVPVLQSGRLDIVLSSTVSTFQAIEQGLDAMVLAPGAIVRTAPPDTTTAVV